MLCGGFLSFVVLSLAGVLGCLADVSLILPDFDPQPLSVNIVGVGANGETTYYMFPGQPTGTWVGQDPAFSGTVTVIEDASEVVIEYANTALFETLVESCSFANGVAECVDVSPGMMTVTMEAPATPILVQGGGTASPGPTGIASQAVAPAPGSSAPGISAATRSAPSPSVTLTKSASSGVRLTPEKAVLAGMLVVLVILT